MKAIFQQTVMIAALIATGSGVALAQTQITRPTSTPAMSQMQNGGMMQNADMMQNGDMMNMMMGDDPVAACAAMMNAIAKDPVLHKRMNQVMMQQMKG